MTPLLQSPMAELAWWDALDDHEVDAHTAGPEASVADCIGALQVVGTGAGETILDLGCGTGRIMEPLARAMPDTTFVGIDISPRMIERAREHATRNAAYRTCDGRTIPGHEMFDGAYSLFLAQHIPLEAVQGYLLELAQRLIPGGRLRLQYVEGFIALPGFLNHQHDYYDDIAPALLTAGFEVTDIDRGLLHPSWTWVTAEARL